VRTKPLSNLTENAVTIADIASMMNASASTAARKTREPGFPSPIFPPHVTRVRYFDGAAVEAYLRGLPDRKGAPPRHR
jgi:hypothetical protein